MEAFIGGWHLIVDMVIDRNCTKDIVETVKLTNKRSHNNKFSPRLQQFHLALAPQGSLSLGSMPRKL